jgi:hypothetical protein
MQIFCCELEGKLAVGMSHLVLEKQTKCIPICMAGSSFIHIVDKSE